MKISKLLIVGVLASALCMVVPATAHVVPPGADTNILVGSISRPALAYQDGDVIHYTVTVRVPAAGGDDGSPCQQENVDVQVTLPDGTVINFPTIDFINPGESFTFNATDDIRMDYTIDHADEVGGAITASLNAESQFAHIASIDIFNATLTRDIGTVVFHPDVAIDKIGDIDAFCEGDDPTVTYTYFVDNTGDEDLTNIVVSDDTCSPVTGPTGDDGDGFLNPGETWTYECSVQLTATTVNEATVTGEGAFTAEPVEATDTWEVVELPPPTVSVDPEVAEICEGGDPVELCALVTGGVGPFTYLWSPGGATTQCITVTEAGEYCVTVTDTGTRCEDTACGTVRVIEQPDCSIDSGPTSLCDDQIDIPQEYCTLVVADNYEWVVDSGPGIIPGDNLSPCVEVVPTGLGTIVLVLHVSNDVAGDGLCENACRIEILVEECGRTFCSFTQGYYGNPGGKKCGGQTTTELLNALLGFGDVVVGVPGRSITFDSAECIIQRLPAGGTPAALPDTLGDAQCDTLPNSLVKKNKPEINNVLVGQVVTLTLNVRLGLLPCIDNDETDGLLGLFVIPRDPFCTVGLDDEDGCPKQVDVGGFAGMTVDELLALANAALGGEDISPYTFSQINGAVTAINEGFDECRTVVSCPTEEICDNGCDDDFDGLTDLDDLDCQTQ